MQELDDWTELNILAPFGPLIDISRHPWDWENVHEKVKKAIRTKVLESYRNGLRAAGAKPAPQPLPERRKTFRR